MELKKAVSIVLTSTLLLSILLVAIPKAYAQTTTVRFYASPYEIHTLSEIFTVACVVEDVDNLSAFVLQMEWNTSLLEYQSHHNTYVATAWPAPNTPSPYAGVLTGTASELPGTGVDPVAGIQRIDVFTLPATQFDGDGTLFTMTFKALNTGLFGDPLNYISTALDLTEITLVDDLAAQIPADVFDGEVRLYEQEFVYPPVPLLKVNPATYEAGALGEVFDYSVWLLGDGPSDLSPFWDVAGIDIYMNFDPTLIQATAVDIDPDGEFEGFWPGGLYMLIGGGAGYEINNVAGTVHVAYMGLPLSTHTAPYGQINMFSVTFTAIAESTSFPPPSAPITLKNPVAYYGEYRFNSIGGLMNPAAPLGTDWHEITPTFSLGPYDLTGFEDNGAAGLSTGDQVILDDGTFYFDYYVKAVKGGLDLDHLGTEAVESDIWVASFGPDNIDNNGLGGRYIGTDDPYDGFGTPYWTGNFSMPGLSAVDSITVHQQDGYSYALVEGVDYLVHAADDLIELLTPVDVRIENEFIGTMPNVTAGWPAIEYVASAFESCYVMMDNGTNRYAVNIGYCTMDPAGEYWFDPDYTWELESYFATGYFPGPWVWPDGTDIYLNYTAASTLEVAFLTEPEGPYFLDYPGSYGDFLSILPAANGTIWDEVYYKNWRDHTIIEWTDVNTNTLLDAGDGIKTLSGGNVFVFDVVNPAVELVTGRKPWICEEDPADEFFGWAPIVQVAGFPQPNADYCPWHNKEYSVPLPHKVENAMYTAPYKSLGGDIDVFLCNHAPGFKGEGKNKPADMRWPQKDLCLCANVTYAGWPEQNKDVAFEIKFPNGTVFVVVYARTNATGTACVTVRMPWPCDDPEAIFGKWKVWATVDVACIVVNDTLEFKYDYRIHIWDVTPNKTEYKHCEDIIVTIDYGSYLIQTSLGHLIITLTVTDDSGVPIGFDYINITLGSDDMADWCKYLNGTVELSVHVVKWARPSIGTIYVGALTDFPQNGGSAETPVYITQVTILAEWA